MVNKITDYYGKNNIFVDITNDSVVFFIPSLFNLTLSLKEFDKINEKIQIKLSKGVKRI